MADSKFAQLAADSLAAIELDAVQTLKVIKASSIYKKYTSFCINFTEKELILESQAQNKTILQTITFRADSFVNYKVGTAFMMFVNHERFIAILKMFKTGCIMYVKMQTMQDLESETMPCIFMQSDTQTSKIFSIKVDYTRPPEPQDGSMFRCVINVEELANCIPEFKKIREVADFESRDDNLTISNEDGYSSTTRQLKISNAMGKNMKCRVKVGNILSILKLTKNSMVAFVITENRIIVHFILSQDSKKSVDDSCKANISLCNI